MTPLLLKSEAETLVQTDIQTRIRDGVKAVLEQILEEEMTQHLGAGPRERTPDRRGERNGRYGRALITPVGKIEQLQVPRDREGEFLTEVFERYQRMTGNVEEALLEMHLQGVSTRKVARITQALSRVKISKDVVSRIAGQLEEQLTAWRQKALTQAYPYLYLDALYLKVNWSGSVTDLALLVALGVNAEGFREVLAIEPAGGERKEAYRNLLKGLLERGLHGVELVISDDHESIHAAVSVELAGVKWQRCMVHFERNVMAHVPAKDMAEVAADLKGVFAVQRKATAEKRAEEFIAEYAGRFPKAVEVFRRGIGDALTYLDFPSSHHRKIRSTNVLERLIREVKRRTKVVGVFPTETSAANLATAVALRATEEWAERRYLDMGPLTAMKAGGG